MYVVFYQFFSCRFPFKTYQRFFSAYICLYIIYVRIFNVEKLKNFDLQVRAAKSKKKSHKFSSLLTFELLYDYLRFVWFVIFVVCVMLQKARVLTLFRLFFGFVAVFFLFRFFHFFFTSKSDIPNKGIISGP